MSAVNAIQAYPLAWPAGWRVRDAWQRKPAAFASARRPLSVMDGIDRVLRELKQMGVLRDDIVISTNIPTRLDGLPRSDRAEPSEPGVAVYWTRDADTRRATQCMAIDRYTRVADNLAAIAATLDAMRAIQRHGGGEILDRAFMGFVALPAPEQPWQTLGLATSRPTRDEIDAAYQRLAREHHPDRGGDTHTMARINAARDDLYRLIQS